MEFISSALLMIVVAIIAGTKLNSINKREYIEEKQLYDKETLDIMIRYDLITEDQYRDMIEIVTKNV